MILFSMKQLLMRSVVVGGVVAGGFCGYAITDYISEEKGYGAVQQEVEHDCHNHACNGELAGYALQHSFKEHAFFMSYFVLSLGAYGGIAGLGIKEHLEKRFSPLEETVSSLTQ